MTRRRLSPDQRRGELVTTAAQLFADRAYDDVRMEEVAAAAGVSRALLYRYFPAKNELFLAVYEQAAGNLLAATEPDPALSPTEYLLAGLDIHLDYFAANRNTVLAANLVLARDSRVQAVITGELAQLRERLLDRLELSGDLREQVGGLVKAWLELVRVLCVDWLDRGMTWPREQVRDACAGALLGGLQPLLGDDG